MNNKSATFKIHSVCLIAIFILGNTLLTFPSGGDAFSGIYALGVAVLLSLPFFGIYGKLMVGKSQEFLSGRFGKALAIPLLTIAFFGTLTCSRDYALFIDTMRLPNTSLIVITGVFVALSFLLGLGADKVMYLFSLVGLIVVAFVLAVIFMLSIPNIKWEYLGYALKPDFPAAFRQGVGIFIHSFGQSILLVFFLKGNKGAISHQFSGLCLGALLLGVTFLNVLGVVGRTVAQITYPYITVGEMVKVGVGYSRMEGFTYLVYFLCALIKNSLLVSVSLKIGSAFGGRFKKGLYFILPLVALLGVSQWGKDIFTSDILNVLILIFELTLPLVFLFKKGLSKN